MSEISVINFDDDMLPALDDVLHCRMCKGYFTYCVMAVCGHNYCSNCIRKRMRTNKDCPFCYEDIQEADLRNNKLVDKVVRIYEKSKLKSKSKVTQEKPTENTIKVEEFFESVSNLDEDTHMKDISSDSSVINTTNKNDNSTRNIMIISSDVNNTVNEDGNSTRNSMIISSNVNNTAIEDDNSTRNSTIISSGVNTENHSATNVESDLNISNDFDISCDSCINIETHSSDDSHTIKASQEKSTIFNGQKMCNTMKVLKLIYKEILILQENQRKILSNQNTIWNKICTMSSKVDHQCHQTLSMSSKKVDSVPAEGFPTHVFPLKSMEDIQKVEKLLKDTEKAELMKNWLAQSGGSTVDNTVKRVLQALFTNAVAQQYSWLGAKGKEVFSVLKISKVIFDTVRMNSMISKPVTNFAIETSIKNWLRHAKMRNQNAVSNF